jgi:Flp pilus assembly protein TadG
MLPPQAWSDGNNVRFREGRAERVQGYVRAYDPPSIAPYHVLFVQVPSGPYWAYAGLTAIYATDGTSNADVSRTSGGAYAATADSNWTGGVLGEVPVLNNGVDDPQFWASPSLGTDFALLTNWPANTKCKALRPFQQYLVALDVTKSGTRYPQMVKWSHPADPGSVPSSWDPTDPTKDAGEYELKETSDYCVDCLPLRDTNIIYKEYSTWGMRPVGGVFVFRFYNIFNSIGMMSRRCGVEYFSGKHFVLGFDDLVIHDGQQAQSLLTQRWRRAFFSDMDTAKYVRNFVVADPANKEVWACYVPNGGTFPSKALVWKYDEDRLSIRDIPLVAHAAVGVVDISGSLGGAWSADSAAWSSDITTWDETSFNPAQRNLLLAVPGSTRLFRAPTGLQADGSNYTAFVERTGIGIPLKADGPPDYSVVKSLTRLWPRVTGDAGGVINVYVGGQDSPEGVVEWQGPYSYIIGTTDHIDALVTARLHAVRFESTAAFSWSLHGYDLEVAYRGRI